MEREFRATSRAGTTLIACTNQSKHMLESSTWYSRMPYSRERNQPWQYQCSDFRGLATGRRANKDERRAGEKRSAWPGWEIQAKSSKPLHFLRQMRRVTSLGLI
jgi:hypothetical protein